MFKLPINFSLMLYFVLFSFVVGKTYGDNETFTLDNWISVTDNENKIPEAIIKFDQDKQIFQLDAIIEGDADSASPFLFDKTDNSLINAELENCDFSGGWIGTTDQGKEVIFKVANRFDITRIQIDVTIDKPLCNKNFGTGFSGTVGTIENNKFAISDIVICGVRLSIGGNFTSCNNIEGRWLFHCPSCGSVSGAWNAELDLEAPDDITNLIAVPGDAKVNLSWVNPPNIDFNSTRIQRSQISPPLSQSDGTTVFIGSSSSFEDTCVSNGKQYFYTAFTSDKVSNFSAGVNVAVELE